MKRIIGIIFLFLILLSCRKPSEGINDKKAEAERNRISKLGLKSLTEFSYLWIDSLKMYSDKKIKTSFIQYDHSGNVVSEIGYDVNGSERSKTNSEFDNDGNMKFYASYTDSKLTYKIVKEYNKNQKEIGYLYYSENDSPYLKSTKIYQDDMLRKEVVMEISSNDTFKIIYYDDKGKILEERHKNIFPYRAIYIWAVDGKQVTINEFTKSGDISEIVVKQFDNNGNEVKKVETIPYTSDTLRNYFLTDYDSQENKIREVWYRPINDTIYIKSWKYDVQNRLMQIANDEFDYFHTNDRGEISVKHGMSKHGKITSYVFEHDNKGNIIKALGSLNGEPHIMSIYEYNYWK